MRRTREQMLELVAEWQLAPLEPYPGAQERWRCLCLNCGAEVVTRYTTLCSRRTKIPCRTCSYAVRNIDLRLNDAEAIASARGAGIEPVEPFPGVHRRWQCRCLACGHEFPTLLANIRTRGGGCPECAQVVRASKRRSPEAGVVALMRSADLEPLEPFANVDKPWPCLCLKCGRQVSPTVTNIRAGNGGCRYCASFGLNWEAPAIVYLLTHQQHLSNKIGVAKKEPRRNEFGRIALLARFGWSEFTSLEVTTGRGAFAIEQAVLYWLRTDLQLPPHLSRADTEGWTETVSSDAVSVTTMWERILFEAAARRA